MQRHALAFRIKPGSQAAVADLFAGYRPPALRVDERTRLLGTAVFMRGDLVVRAVEIEGEFDRVTAHLARDPGVQEIERALLPHLAEPYDPTDSQARGRSIARRRMDRIVHRGATGAEPADATSPTRHALLYPVRPDRVEAAAGILAAAGDPPLRQRGTRLLDTSVFGKDGLLVRIFRIAGRIDDLVEGLSEAVAVHNVGAKLAGLFEGPYDFTTADGLRHFFTDNLMATVTDRTAPVAAAEASPETAATEASHEAVSTP